MEWTSIVWQENPWGFESRSGEKIKNGPYIYMRVDGQIYCQTDDSLAEASQGFLYTHTYA